MSIGKLTFFTSSYRRDIERFVLLRESIRRFYHGEARHFVVVPREDILFGERLACDQIALQRFYGHTPEKENIFDPPDRKTLLSIKQTLKDPVFKRVKVWMEGLADVKNYNFSIADRFNYSKHFISVKVRKLYDCHIAWRFK